jgi:hypothetical protein
MPIADARRGGFMKLTLKRIVFWCFLILPPGCGWDTGVAEPTASNTSQGEPCAAQSLS